MSLDITASDRFAEATARILDDCADLEGPLLPILHSVQAAFGYVPQEVVPLIAERLNMTGAEVHGVVSFYHDFRTEPAGRHVVRLCRSEACQAMGSDALAAAAGERLGVTLHGTTADGAVTLEPVYCLGMCACGPAAMVDDKVVGRLDAAKLAAILDEVTR